MNEDLETEVRSLRGRIHELETKIGWYKAVNMQLRDDLAEQHEDQFITYFRQALQGENNDIR